MEGGRWESVFARLQHTPGIRQWDPKAENWVPIGASIWDPDPRLGSRSSGGSYLEIGGRAPLGRLRLRQEGGAFLMDGDRPGRGVEVPQVATSAALRAGALRVEKLRIYSTIRVEFG